MLSRRITALVLAALVGLAVAACNSQESSTTLEPTLAPSFAPIASPSEEPSEMPSDSALPLAS